MINNTKHYCKGMPTGYYINQNNYLVSLGLDMSVELSEKPCNFCPFCGKDLNKK